MSVRRHIPNAVTSLNLLSGSVAIVATLAYHEPFWAMIFIALAAVFDLLDGLFARILGVSSPIGADLDSLADVVSFGLAPAVLVFAHFSLFTSTVAAIVGLGFFDVTVYPVVSVVAASPAFLLAVFAALRLAKFNNDQRQHTSFLGLPVPANALFWLGFVALDGESYRITAFCPILMQVLLYAFVLLMSYLMVSDLPMFSFKIKRLGWRGNEQRYVVLLASVAFVALWGVGGLALSIISYVLLSIVLYLRSRD